MRSSSDSLEMPGGVLVVVGSMGQMSFFLTKRGDCSSISWPSMDSRAACASRTFCADLYEHTPTRTAQHRFTDTPLPARGDPARVAPEGRKAIAVKIETGDAPPMQMHPDQLPVSLGVVRELVDQQFPEWQGLPISEVASHGTVNALFRIGDKFVARFPLEPEEVTATRRWLESEAQAARELSGCTRFLTPEPVALGEPVAGYPLPWAVQTWLPGTVATVEDPGESVGFAHDLS